MIRLARIEDISIIKEIYNEARTYMYNNGNKTQWPSFYPNDEIITNDIKNNSVYVGLINGDISFCFTFIIGEDETYKYIENGKWINSLEYGTIHRLASNQACHNVFNTVLCYCLGLCNSIRIDTHANNHTMKHLIIKYGFIECGTIYVKDNKPRIAYQYYGV